MEFNKQNLKQIRLDIDQALASVKAKYGMVELKINNIRFASDHFSTKLTARLTPTAPFVNDNDHPAIGKRFTFQGKTYEIIDFNPRRYKRPVIAKNITTNKEFVFSREFLAMAK